MPSQTTLLKRIQARNQFTQSEQKIVAFIKDNMNQLAFETVTSISQKTDVSKATVVRFIASLGYNGFADFQQQLRDQVVDRLQAPITRLPKMKETLLPNGENVLEQSFSHIIESLNKTLATIDRARFLQVARLITQKDQRVFIDGHRSSGGLARILWLKLQYLRAKVFLLDASTLTTPDMLSDISENDILFSITQSRYCNASRQITSYFSDAKATIIMLTDNEWAPDINKADIKLVADAEGYLIFNNACSMLAIIETLILAVAQLSGEGAYENATRNEKLFHFFDTFAID